MKTTRTTSGLLIATLAAAGLIACQPATEQADAPAAHVPEDFPPRAGNAATTPPEPASTQTRWRCDELLVATTHHDDVVELFFSGRTLQMPIAVSASGARYADDQGNEFWSKGETAMLTLAGAPKRDCAVTQDISPWEDARKRGITFRAVGNEPGWWVEVGSGDSPPLTAALDFGQRRIEVAQSQGISSTPGFGGKTADGTDVVLRIQDQPCADVMSGEQFEASAELSVGDQVYRGCGARLGK